MLHDLLSHLSGITLCKWKAGWLSWPGVSEREASMYPPSLMGPLEKWRLGWRHKQQTHEPVLRPIHPPDAHKHMLSSVDLIVQRRTHNFIWASVTVSVSQILMVFEHNNKVTAFTESFCLQPKPHLYLSPDWNIFSISNGVLWNSVQTLIVLRGRIVLTLLIPWLLL